jgi:hypothetical protein
MGALCQLQRGRGPETAESLSLANDLGIGTNKLQRGRGPETAESDAECL